MLLTSADLWIEWIGHNYLAEHTSGRFAFLRIWRLDERYQSSLSESKRSIAPDAIQVALGTSPIAFSNANCERRIRMQHETKDEGHYRIDTNGNTAEIMGSGAP